MEEGFRVVVQDSGIRKVAQYVDIDMPGTALRQDGVETQKFWREKEVIRLRSGWIVPSGLLFER